LIITGGLYANDFLTPGVPETGYDAWEQFDTRTTRREHFPELGVTIEYTADWVTNVAPMPYATCTTCTVIGPSQSDFPYGIQFFRGEHQLGCQLTCYLNIRALAQEATHTIDVNGHVGFRQEFERQRPLDGENDRTSYREILTVLPLAPIVGLAPEAKVPALFIDGFYRYGDAPGEAQTREALARVLSNLEIVDASGR
jgi:hypothetical protein